VGIFNLWSKRKAAQAGRVPELQSEHLPEKFRVQASQILLGAIRPWEMPSRWQAPTVFSGNDAWMHIFKAIAGEHGQFALSECGGTPAEQCIDFVLKGETDEVLDLIEVALGYIETHASRLPPDHYFEVGLNNAAAVAADEFNTRFRENGVGYQFEFGRIIPASSSYVHTQVVEPALALLHDEGFLVAQDEFLKAHEHLRRGDHEAAIVEAGKAFESAMRAVCDRKRWAYNPAKATPKDLIPVLFDNGLVRPYLQAQFTSLRALLESGPGTVRNKDGAHGRGSKRVEVPRELAEYALHLTAANIVFLVKSLQSS
jgi:hypothetical protein